MLKRIPDFLKAVVSIATLAYLVLKLKEYNEVNRHD